MTYRVLIPSDSDPVSIANKDDVIVTLLLEVATLREQRCCVVWPDGWIECRG